MQRLVAGVGSINNTFGIKGVEEHTFFFKSITDANKLRRQVSECFERAALPNTSHEVRPLHTQKAIGRNGWQRAVCTCFPYACSRFAERLCAAGHWCFCKTIQNRNST